MVLTRSTETSYTMLVMVVAKELNVPLQFVSINFSTYTHKVPEYVAKQPFGKVPCLANSYSPLYSAVFVLTH